MNLDNRKIIHIYILSLISWIVILAAFLVFPYWSSNSAWAILLSLTFLFVCSTTDLVGFKILNRFIKFPVIKRSSFLPHFQTDKLSVLFLLIGFIGLCFHIYDKFFIRKYYFDECTGIREMWLQDGVSRGGGISSIYSAFGHLLLYFSVIPALLLIKQGRFTWVKFATAVLGLALLIVYCYTLSSRSTIIYASILLATTYILSTRIKSMLKMYSKIGVFLCLSALAVLVYANVTFEDRIACQKKDYGNFKYVENNLSDHAFKSDWSNQTSITIPNTDVFKFAEQQLRSAKDSLHTRLSKSEFLKSKTNIMITLYLTNPTSNFDKLIETREDIPPTLEYGNLTNIFVIYLNKFGLDLPLAQTSNNFTGLLSFPGFMYKIKSDVSDFILLSFLLGLFFCTYRFMASRIFFLNSMAPIVYSIILFSIFSPAFKTMSFPFFCVIYIVFGFCTEDTEDAH